MSNQTLAAPTCSPEGDDSAAAPYSRVRLAAGIIGRAWLWFLLACLAITLLPILFGWRPYLIESGSMEPRIHVGDVVLAAPIAADQDLLGHVIVFNDPDRAGQNKSHRVVAVDSKGDLVTRGDANPTNDNVHVSRDQVHGLGRLLVRYIGLPVIWLQTGQWLWLLLFLASLVAAVLAVTRDHEEDEATPDDGSDEDPRDTDTPADGPVPGTVRAPTQNRSSPELKRSGHPRRPRPRRGFAVILALLGAQVLLIGTASAAFSATTRSPGNNWTAANLDYTTQANALGPYLYWKLDDASAATTAVDSSGNGRTGTYNGTFTKQVVGALVTDTPNLAVTATAASCINTTSATSIAAPTNVTVVAWFRTNSATGGKLLGFENPQTGTVLGGGQGTYDRHLYIDGSGKVWFGVYNGGFFTLGSTAAGLNNNQWHMAVGILSSTVGMSLYVDGALQATNTNKIGENTQGFWRAGCGNLSGWGGSWTGAGNPGTASGGGNNSPYLGSLDELTVYNSVLTAAQIGTLYYAR